MRISDITISNYWYQYFQLVIMYDTELLISAIRISDINNSN